ncbi:exodeoxyribonuclease-3 [Pilibacter termitis]|uniref:Exodeoxyribonuclease-3 n=1 Tax=Pilibacter termitis TaxID=263852 RepID=A0A1T4MRY1_9ENTE|nr:exodeoxyribonuclease III [Pilibacter termitis]SJZ69840.1 exodeoxyribonuclease-3 [Pilibacter termitis]
MKCISWNVNGLRAVQKKRFEDIFKELDADIFAVQETKLQEGQIDLNFPEYAEYWNYAEKKGYSGVAIWSKKEANTVTYGIGIEEHDHEGRVITLEFDKFYFVNCYTPNTKRDLSRLDYRENWEDDFRQYLVELNKKKPVILCGDLNVAHENIDLKNWKTNQKNAGFTPEERAKFSILLAAGFTDTFRYKYPSLEGAYSWWSYQFNARANNAGWRIDYFITSNSLDNKILDAKIYPEIFGSDHCPVGLEIDL